MQLVPSRTEARLLILTVQVFWFSAGVGFALILDTPAFAPVFLVGMISCFAFYFVAYRIAARELGFSTASFLVPFTRDRHDHRSFWQRGRDGWLVLFKLIDPRWWHSTVARRSGWPVLLVDAVMIVGLVAAVLGQRIALPQ